MIEQYLKGSDAVASAQNLFEVQLGALEYFKEFGIERSLINGQVNISRESIEHYLSARAHSFNITVNLNNLSVEEFKLRIGYDVG